MPKIKRVLISLSDKAGVVEFAKTLDKFGVEILSTGGTAKALRDSGLKVVDVSEYTGSPEILDGRLKTLHPKIHGGLLGMRNSPKHKQEMEHNGIKDIDMVVVNLYPFEATIARNDVELEEAIENIDIGGPTMLRAAAKNWQDVAVIVDPADYKVIAEEIIKSGGVVSRATCFRLAQKVFATTARYDAAICNYINSVEPTFEVDNPVVPTCGLDNPEVVTFRHGVPKRSRFPSTLALTYEKAQDLRYGENPHQSAVFYKCPRLPKDFPCITNGKQLHGKELSYNNIMDSDAALELAREFKDEIAAVIIKHATPCGVAVSPDSISKAFLSARDCDPVSAFGGIVALTRAVDEATAKMIGDTFFEVIIAPGFDRSALSILQSKKNLRLLTIPPFDNGGEGGFNLRKVRGGLLVQDYDEKELNVSECKVVTKRKPTDDEMKGLLFNWRVVKHVKSNAIVIGGRDRIYGAGGGQTNRVDSVKIAVERMEKFAIGASRDTLHEIRVMASDAFFPFRDGVDSSAKAGITAIIQPGGSIRDDDAIKAADEHNIAMVFTGIRHFRH